MLHGDAFVLAEGEEAVGALHHGDVQTVLGHTHHGAAHDQLGGGLQEAAAGVDQVLHRGADAAFQVLGIGNGAAGDRDDPADGGHTGGEETVDGGAGVGVEHRGAGIGGQLAGGNFPAGQSIDDVFFRALGILGHQGIELDAAILREIFPQLGEGVLLVELDAQLDLVHTKDLAQQLCAADHFPGVFQHDPVVRGDIGLALGSVDDDRIHLAQTGRDLHGRGEGRAAVTDDTGLADRLHDLFRGHGVDIQRVDRGIGLILEVVLDDNAEDIGPEGIGSGLDRHHGAGDRRMDGCGNRSLRVSDLLSQINMVAYLDNGLTGLADVHGHGQNHLCGSR